MNNHVSVSNGNKKLGLIKSISLPPVITCRKNAPCVKDCYACKICRYSKQAAATYQNNLEIYRANPAQYFGEIRHAAALDRFFRWHVSGDIPDAAYLQGMIDTAERLPGTVFLAFTKQYEIVNDYISINGPLPSNLKIIFSQWGDFIPENSYGLPFSAVIFPGSDVIPDNWKICGGNCTECACRGVGCWELKNGETLAFYKH